MIKRLIAWLMEWFAGRLRKSADQDQAKEVRTQEEKAWGKETEQIHQQTEADGHEVQEIRDRGGDSPDARRAAFKRLHDLESSE